MAQGAEQKSVSFGNEKPYAASLPPVLGVAFFQGELGQYFAPTPPADVAIFLTSLDNEGLDSVEKLHRLSEQNTARLATILATNPDGIVDNWSEEDQRLALQRSISGDIMTLEPRIRLEGKHGDQIIIRENPYVIRKIALLQEISKQVTPTDK